MESEERFQIAAITSFNVRIAPEEWKVPERWQQQVEEIWKQEKQRRKEKLFNGSLLSFVTREGTNLIGRSVDYKSYLAQLHIPQLKGEFNICPIAVNGMTIAGDCILIGKRAKHVTIDPSCYELVPSGTIDGKIAKEGKIDYLQQLKIELQEETGIDAASIRSMYPLGWIIDQKMGNLEICVEIQLPEQIRNTCLVSEEYTDFQWIEKKHILSFFEGRRAECVELSLVLCKMMGKRLDL